RLLAAGYGESRPLASNATAAGKQENRRVEIRISPYVN
ncbi:MAG: cell envelope biogenesis protein OmpA, partial [Pseudomonadota bacterium]